MKPQTEMSARRLAWDALIATEAGAFADAVLGRALDDSPLDPRDAGLATRMVYGTLAWQALFDHHLAALGQPADQLDPHIRTLLRLSLFQLLKLSRVPEFAVVNTAVELAKTYRKGAASRFVNAILRRFLREKDSLALPRREVNIVEFFSVAYSHPRWLVETWLNELGEAETEALLAANNEAAPTALRVNQIRSSCEQVLALLENEGVGATTGRWSPDAVILDDGISVQRMPVYRDGAITPQGEASQLVTALLDATPGQEILDVCAAPGGKTTHIAERLQNRGRVVAVDINRNGLEVLRTSAARLGHDCLEIIAGDAVTVIEDLGLFDAILVDAPCSGLGTLRQHPEIRWRRTPSSIGEMAKHQVALLHAAAGHVKPGRTLVYSTCTILRAENEDVVSAFLRAHPEFEMADPRTSLPESTRELVGSDSFFRSFPHRHGLDGFFAAQMRKQQAATATTVEGS